MSESADPCSLANLHEFQATHLDWSIVVDFTTQTLQCVAKQQFTCLRQGVTKLLLDTSSLTVTKVLVDESSAAFSILDEQKPFGQPLQIEVPPTVKDSIINVEIHYTTSNKATAVQYLSKEQTLSKTHPYLFTQCQAIHARSLLPCQDSPGHKITYNASVTVPSDMVALMSAVKGEETLTANNKKKCLFQQKICISPYLLALAVGALESREIGHRSKVWCEAPMIEACKEELCEVEQQLQAGEQLMGPYVWGQYDVLVLPPSFPYGGMENPCLTFSTPSIIVGDKSLTALIAHEITHSWTGNLVTNLTWEHFWLNEGFTRFLEGKIVGLLSGEQTRQFMAIAGWSSLKDTIDVFGANNPLTHLQPVLRGIDPDDAFSSVPYEKGYAFLYHIETLVGGPDAFNPFLRSYIDKFKHKSIVTQDFKDYLCDYFKDKMDLTTEIDWNAWLHSPGMPPVDVIDTYDHSLSKACKELCGRWIVAAEKNNYFSFEESDFSSFTTGQKIRFLVELYQRSNLPLEGVKQLSSKYNLDSYKNAEIKFAYLRLCVRVNWEDRLAIVVEFLLQLGRMKFVRPLYREMYKQEGDTRQLAIQTFDENREIYHSITASMVAKDLHLNE